MPRSIMQDSAPWAIVEAQFVAAAPRVDAVPPATVAEIAFAGRSNVGKSSLMNALLGRRRLVRTSSTPGCTRALAFFRARARDGLELMLVDLPGYGYAKRSHGERAAWARLVEDYLRRRTALRAVVVLIDARHGPTADDLRLVEFVRGAGSVAVSRVVVATKLDKVPKSKQRAAVRAVGQALGCPALGASAVTGEGVVSLWRTLRQALPEAPGTGPGIG